MCCKWKNNSFLVSRRERSVYLFVVNCHTNNSNANDSTAPMNPSIASTSVHEELGQTTNPVGPDSTMQQEQVTFFDAPESHSETTVANMSQTEVEVVHQDIKHFLARPIRVGALQWTTSSQVGAVLGVFDPLRNSLSNSLSWNKLDGFQYLRSTVKVRFQVTGNAFFGGKLRAVWIPPNRAGTFSTPYSVSLPAVTGIQIGIDIYPTDNAVYELDIPCILPQRFFDLARSYSIDWSTANPYAHSDGPTGLFTTNGLVAIYVIAPLITELPTDSCSVVPFTLMENIDIGSAFVTGGFTRPQYQGFLSNPDIQPAIAPLGHLYGLVSNAQRLGPPYSVAIEEEEKTVKYTLNALEFTRAPGYKAPPPETVRKQYTTRGQAEAKEAVKEGRWSGVTKSLAAVTGAVTPFMGAYAPIGIGATVFLTAAAAVLQKYNLDKPLLNKLTTPIYNRWKNLNLASGGNEAVHLGILADNAVSPFGPNQWIDPAEMSIPYICSIPQLQVVTPIHTSATPNSVVMQWGVAPWNVGVPSETFLDGSPGAEYNTYASYVNSAFTFWRGDLVVTVEVVAQAFSKMALGLSWFPSNDFSTGDQLFPTFTVDNFTSSNYLTEIVNVSGTTKATFRIPFVNTQFALRSQVHSVHPNSYSQPCANGRVVIYVVNPLTVFNPNALDTNPVYLCFYTHWENLSFGRPSANALHNAPARYSEVTYNVPGPAIAAEEEPEVKYHLNSASVLVMDPDSFNGENVCHLMDLIRRPGILTGLGLPGVVGNLSTTATYIVSLFRSFPYTFSTPTLENFGPLTPNVTIPTARRTQFMPSSYVNYFSRLFVTWRGEVTYTVVQPFTGNGTNAEGELYPIMLSNYQDARFLPRSYPVTPVGNKDAPGVTARTPGGLLPIDPTYGSGVFYRPAAQSANPPSVSIPYYATESHFLTPDVWTSGLADFRVTTFNRGTAPAVRIDTLVSKSALAAVFPTVLVEAGDNFSFGMLYPPPVSLRVLSYYPTGGPVSVT